MRRSLCKAGDFMENTIFETYESNVRSYCRNYPVVFDKAQGAYMIDENNNYYLDFFCGAGALNYGHNHPFIKDKLIAYLKNDRIIHTLDMYTVAKREFIEYFEERVLKPRGFNYKIQFVGPTGTNAVEAALKLARLNKKRQNIFALMGGFHGMTLGSLALTTDAESREGAGVVMSNVTHIPAPYMFPELDTIKYMETLLTDDHSGVAKPAAIILESMQADGGVYPLDAEWLRRVRAFCDKYDLLMIVDDIQAGCGRCGNFFSFERAGIVPDIVTVSKSIGGYGMPMSVVLLKPELDIWKPGQHSGTFRGNQLSFVAAKAALQIMNEQELGNKTLKDGEFIASYLPEHVRAISPDLEVRGIGLFWGIDFNALPDPNISKEVISECFRRGLIVERAGRKNAVLKIMPPLIIEREDLQRGLDIILDSIKTVIS